MKKELFLLVMMLLPIVANADITWTYAEDTKTLSILGRGEMKDYDNGFNSFNTSPWYQLREKIESVVIEDGVLSIGAFAFYNFSALTTITIAKTVTCIGSDSFYNCTSLKEITIPNSVTSIGDGAFNGCSNLTDIVMPNSVTNIGRSAFSGCTGLTNVSIPNSVTSIGSYVFSGCINLTSVNLPNNVNSLSYGVFSGCSKLTSISIPNSITEIGEKAFYGCSSLASIEIPNSVTSIGVSAFWECISLTSISIPNSVICIGSSAFSGCTNLTNIDISDSVKDIGRNSFLGTSWIKEQPKGLVYAGKVLYVYNGIMPENTCIALKDGTVSISPNAFSNCSGLISINIPNSVTNIGQSAFSGCTNLATIDVPNSVTSIGNDAFSKTAWYDSQCDGLVYAGKVVYKYKGKMPDGTSVDIEEGTASISSYAFAYCTSLSSITLPNSLTSIGEYAFYKCSSLTGIIIPNTVTCIGHDAFNGCFSLMSVNIPSSLNMIEDYTFNECSSLTEVDIPKSVTSIGSGAFSNCTNLTIIDIPNSVTNISNFAFERCSSMTSITIPNSVTLIGDFSFRGCENLKNVYCLPEKVPSIGSSIFSSYPYIFVNDSSLPSYRLSYLNQYGTIRSTELEVTEVGGLYYLLGAVSPIAEVAKSPGGAVIEDSICIPEIITHNGKDYRVKYIGNNAFAGWSSLKKITIPQSIISIGISAFSGCYNLQTFTIPNSVNSIGSWAFENCSKLQSITIPAFVETIDRGAFSGCTNLMTITVLTTRPPKLNFQSTTFSNYSATLIVPKGCVEIYKSTDCWSYFSNITEAKYKLTYVVDNVVIYDYEIEEGATIKQETTPTKEGYTFSGWSEIPETMPAKDVTVTGTFSVNKYKLTYSVDGEKYKSYEIDYGTSITPETEPTKEGYTFSGWSEMPETMPAKDVTVTGLFTVNKYKLIYQLDGESYKTIDVEYGATITPEVEPTKEGYTFSGWSEIPETMPANNVTVTGTFSVNKYKLIYSVDGEKYKSYEIDYGTSITPETEPTKEGYTFGGWSEIPETMPANDVTVTGTFSINKYKLAYMVDGVEYKSYDIEYGATITEEAEPTKEGYTFSGWGSIPATMPANDVTISGTFTKGAYKLTYMVDGEVYKTVSYDYDSTITPEAAPTKEGYTFSGWGEIPETMPAKDVTVNGTFTINTYKLTYMIDDKVYKVVEVEYGATITPEPQPEGDYVTFAWIDLPQTMPANDIVVHASYTSGINSLLMARPQDMRIYSTGGKKLSKLRKGVNIIRMGNGKAQKVVVK